jgi:hypothetical protein
VKGVEENGRINRRNKYDLENQPRRIAFALNHEVCGSITELSLHATIGIIRIIDGFRPLESGRICVVHRRGLRYGGMRRSSNRRILDWCVMSGMRVLQRSSRVGRGQSGGILS